MCVFFGKGKGGGGTPHMHGHKDSYKDLNLKILTSEWADSNETSHGYSSTSCAVRVTNNRT